VQIYVFSVCQKLQLLPSQLNLNFAFCALVFAFKVTTLLNSPTVSGIELGVAINAKEYVCFAVQ